MIVSVQTGEYGIAQNVNVGVSYISGSADYAEWLKRMDPEEAFKPGEVVGVYAGLISHNTQGADHLLVISTAPAVLGNMPDEDQEHLFEKVGFLGQVPVMVAGTVSEGDYIVASGNNDGYARAFSPASLPTAAFDQIIGVAWEAGNSPMANVVNVAIGLGSNQLAKRVAAVESELEVLKRQVALLMGESVDAVVNQPSPSSTKTTHPDPDQVQLAAQAYMQKQQKNAFANLDFEAWLAAVAPAVEQEMAALRAFYQEAGIDYSVYPDLAKLFDTPTEALRDMESGNFLPTLWQTIRP